MDGILVKAAELGSSVFITIVFIWYLTKRDKDLTRMMNNHFDHQQKSNLKLAKSLQKLTDVIIVFHRIVNGKN